ncbi:MAG: hypothetical protein JWQ87_3544 [Candidatus Sulfotelmatobacter sp.]|nr:hypothetical protein [Candidatus Sulfotelmatobacter sp.]
MSTPSLQLGQQQFALLYGPNQNLCIQCPQQDGSVPTIQNFDPSNPLNLWVISFQQNLDGYYGFAFVNTKTNLSITYNGQLQSLVVQPFSFGSADQDAWALINQGGSKFRLAYPPDTSFSWNDYGGGGNAGDQLWLWNDTSPNSLWTVQSVSA